MAHVMKHALDEARGFGARQAELAMHNVGQIGARQSVAGFRLIGDPRDAEIGHKFSPALFDETPDRRFTHVTKTRRVGNSTIVGLCKFFNT
jgi:hypothetical protein